MYIAHKNPCGEKQLLKHHLVNVACLCSDFASSFGAGEHAYRTGLLHDIGKYASDVQQRMLDPEHTPKCNHTSAGAQTALNNYRDVSSAFAIAGHHGGLQDISSLRTGKFSYQPLNYSDYENELSISNEIKEPSWITDKLQLSFYTRMLFSCLVDADYLDTEKFMNSAEQARNLPHCDLYGLLERLEQYISSWAPPESALNEMRCEVRSNCAGKADADKGLFSLTVPTGGGKTISSLLFALKHAVHHNMSRVIYVVPYTNIIEQTASVFSRILGEENVLEHHSGIFYDTDSPTEDIESIRQRQKQLATENWDAPVIITTAVQFFESIYHRQTSSSRKLHSIANSVIIFDEAQMMPLDYLDPCLFTIGELVQHYGVSAVLCTATQPDFHHLFNKYAPKHPVCEITNDPNKLQLFFQRVTYCDDGPIGMDSLVKRLEQEHTLLCIVNTRASAYQLFQLLKGPGCYHLSTWMTPRHRKAVLKIIRERLQSGLPCKVVSTSLIEAGVDLDFPTVFREHAGLDSILQSGGRCNREGKRKKEESIVHIFSLEGKRISPDIRQRINASLYAVENGDAIDSLEAIRRYSSHIIFSIGEGSDKYRILDNCERFNFETVSNDFRLIRDDDTAVICIPNKENEILINSIENGTYDYRTLRLLQKDCVSIYKTDAERLISAGSVRLTDAGLLLLQDRTCYSDECGLCCTETSGNPIFL